jgi:hypothetical protein
MRPINEGEFTNERFFESSTLYKKELKEKQKNYLLQQHQPTPPPPITTIISPTSSPNTCKLTKTQSQQQTQKPTTNKMFNLINSFLNRSHVNSASLKQQKSNTKSQQSILMSTSSTTATHNEQFRLKRTSSTQFNSQKHLTFKNQKQTSVPITYENDNKKNIDAHNSSSLKRLSFDDQYLNEQFDASTTLSCRNSGLIFVPPPQQQQQQQQPVSINKKIIHQLNTQVNQ